MKLCVQKFLSAGVWRSFYSAWIALVILNIGFPNPSQVLSSPESPSSASFLYGARLDMDGLFLDGAIETAAELGLDWIAVSWNWGQAWPQPKALPDLAALSELMSAAQRVNLRVLLSITNAPVWALTADGPHPTLTADLVSRLANQFSNLSAVELFPNANTHYGWGAPPNPEAYLQMLRQTQTILEAGQFDLQLIVGGLIHLGQASNPRDIDDLTFLEALYKNGGREVISIISIQQPELNGEPMASPFTEERRVLRHFEMVRNVMLKNHHPEGMLWITSFSWPSGTIHADNAGDDNTVSEAQWLHQAYNLLSAQLYIGAAFFDSLNPKIAPEGTFSKGPSLILPDGSYHPSIQNLAQLTNFATGNISTVRRVTGLKKISINKRSLKPLSLPASGAKWERPPPQAIFI